MGFVFQFFNLIPTLTVLENVLLPAELAGLRGLGSRARELLERVGLADRGSAFPDRLSGGEQQRVAIARALVRDPRLVLADEPTGNLDDTTGASVLDLLDSVTRRAGKTLLLVTHSREVAARADRVLTIEDAEVRVIPRGLLRTGLRDLVRRPLHTGLMVLGVALGVAWWSRSTSPTRRRVAASSAAPRRSRDAPPTRCAAARRACPRRSTAGCASNGVRPSAPVVEGVVLAPDLGRQPLRVLGVDPLSEAPFRGHLGGGRSPIRPSARFSPTPPPSSSAPRSRSATASLPARPCACRPATASRRSACSVSWRARPGEPPRPRRDPAARRGRSPALLGIPGR